MFALAEHAESLHPGSPCGRWRVPWPRRHPLSTEAPRPQTALRHPLAGALHWRCMAVPPEKRGIRMARKKKERKKNKLQETEQLQNTERPIKPDQMKCPPAPLRFSLRPKTKSSPSDKSRTRPLSRWRGLLLHPESKSSPGGAGKVTECFPSYSHTLAAIKCLVRRGNLSTGIPYMSIHGTCFWPPAD